MKTGFFVVMMFIATLMQCSGNKAVADAQNERVAENEAVSGYGTGKVTQGSWMELFLGMDQDSAQDYAYSCRVPELEGIEGVASQELEATWYRLDADFPAHYRCTHGLYVDKDFPSDKVFRQVEFGIDTLLTQGFCYNDELQDLKQSLALRKGYSPRNTQDILNRAKQVFDLYTKKNNSLKPDSADFRISESRECIVAHKIYDQGDWVSYIIEFSFSYNGSNGCPSWADYFTVNKKTGQRLAPDDIVEKYGEGQVSKKLRQAFVKAKGERNFDLDVYNLFGLELIDAADGCAIVNEGVMFYYRPYSVGCGAEGMYNLVLDLK